MTGESVESFTPTPSVHISRPPSPKKLDLKLNTRSKSRDCGRIVLIVDRKLNNKQIELLNKFYSVYEITEADTTKPINRLPMCDIYIFVLINNIMRPRKSWGAIYYAKSYRWLKLNNYTITYYRTSELIQNYAQMMKYDFLITEFPTDVTSKYDLAEQLLYNSMGYHVGGCGLLLQCLCSRITCADFCSMACGISIGL